MTTYIALLRGINVGGSGILAMKDLVALCADLGFDNPRTYIQSGNVLFKSQLKEDEVRARLARALVGKMGKPIEVMVRTTAELRKVLEGNPFADREPAKVAVSFLAARPPAKELKDLRGPGGEQVVAGLREVYVYYPDGMGRSKLKLPLGGAAATVRNINTIAKLVSLAKG